MRYFFIALIVMCSFAYSFQKKTYSNDEKAHEFKNAEEIQEIKETQEPVTSKQTENEKIGLSISFNPSYFWPQDKTFRDIYKGGFLPLFEVSYVFYKGLGTWLEVGYFHKKEAITIVNEVRATAKIDQVPLSIGLKYTFDVCSYFDIFFKIAPNWVYTKTYIDVPNMKKKTTKNTFGGTFGLGGNFKCKDGWFVKIFLNYLYDSKKIHDQLSNNSYRVHLGGIQTGAGFGYTF